MDIRLKVEGKPRKNLNQEIDPTGDRTRARCVSSIDVTPRPRLSPRFIQDEFSPYSHISLLNYSSPASYFHKCKVLNSISCVVYYLISFLIGFITSLSIPCQDPKFLSYVQSIQLIYFSEIYQQNF